MTDEDAAAKQWKEQVTKSKKKIGTEQPKVTVVKSAAKRRGGQVHNFGSLSFKGKCTMYGFGNDDILSGMAGGDIRWGVADKNRRSEV